MPQTEADYSNFITTLMDSQHKMLTSIHGVDSPQVALSSTLLDLQGSVSLCHHFPLFLSWSTSFKALAPRCASANPVHVW